jgi:hypothetical protein
MMCFDPRVEKIEQALIPIDLSSGKRKKGTNHRCGGLSEISVHCLRLDK